MQKERKGERGIDNTERERCRLPVHDYILQCSGTSHYVNLWAAFNRPTISTSTICGCFLECSDLPHRCSSVAFHLFSYLLLKGQNWSSPCNCSIKIKLFTGNGWLKPDTRAQTTIPHNAYIYLHFPLKGNKKDRHRCDDFPVHCQSDLIFAFICFHVPPERSYFLPFIYSQLEGSARRGAGGEKEGERAR